MKKKKYSDNFKSQVKKQSEYNNILSVFADYAATGIWIDGACADYDELSNLGFDDDICQAVIPMLEQYQNLYESFDFWSEDADYEKTYKLPAYKEYIRLGEDIFKILSNNSPEQIMVEYLDERTGIRYILINDKFVAKEDSCLN